MLQDGTLAVVTGDFHTCALVEGGAVHCWGANASGQLGLGHRDLRTAPATVTTLGPDTRSISAGHAHTCALNDRGQVREAKRRIRQVSADPLRHLHASDGPARVFPLPAFDSNTALRF